MPNEPIKIDLTINYGVPWMTHAAIAGEVSEYLGKVGINVHALTVESYDNGVVRAFADVYPRGEDTQDQTQALAQAVINKYFPGSVPETTQEQAAEVVAEADINAEKDGIVE